ncbi:MAG: hypothetical protein AAFO96_21865 [Bacteroidota bacterium]
MQITISPILTEDDATLAEQRIEALWDAKPGTAEYFELDVLSLLLSEYEKKKYPLPDLNPVEMIKYRMEQMNLLVQT